MRIPHRRSTPGRRLAGAALAASLAVASCDNPACLFGGNCDQDGGGSAAPNPATLPNDHEWIASGAPRVTSFFPSGTTITTDTPIAVVFSESLSSPSIQGAFSLSLESSGGGGGGGLPVPIAAPTLVGDGRVLIVAPLTALQASQTYVLKYADMAVVTDLEGFAVQVPADRVLGRFSVAATNVTSPRVIASFPSDTATEQSATGEYIVVFDRKLDSATVTADSFIVSVNGQPLTTNNPLPQPVLLIGTSGFPTADTRVWRYRSADSEGEAAPLPASALVEVELSPVGDEIESLDGGVLANLTRSYHVAAFGAPLSAEIVSMPTDAVGADNLNGTRPLEVGVQLVGAAANDSLDLFVFGTSPEAGGDTIALARSVRLGDLASFDPLLQTVELGEGELDLASGTAPVETRFAEGSISVALSVRRGSAASAVRLLDVEPLETGVQRPLLDVTAPTLSGFGVTGSNTTTHYSDVQDLVVVARADEELSAAEVVAGVANNGALAPVVGSTSSGLFIAKPVALGLVDPAQLPMSFQLTIYDRALNRATAATSASFTQVGAVVASSAVPAGEIEVEVVDSRTLAALSGARVFVHEDQGGVVTLVDADTTPASGRVTLMAAAVGETIVTVEATNYDLFSLHGAASSRVGVLLTRSNTAAGAVQGVVSSSSNDLPTYDRFIGDTRLYQADAPVITVQPCTPNPQTLTWQCGFGPRPARPGVLGGVGFVAVDPPSSAFTFTAQGFLRGFALELPFASLDPSQTGTVNLRVDQLLDDPDTPDEERAIDGPLCVLDASAAAGFDLQNQDGDPRVQVEGLVPGLRGGVVAGFGAALDAQGTPPTAWAVRSALPGVSDPLDDDGIGPNDELGQLVADGILDDKLFLRCELRDDAGARIALRPRFTANSDVPAMLLPPSVPSVGSPASGSTTAGPSYDVVFDDVIQSGAGVYRVTLVGPTGRAWVLYRADGSGATRSVHLPDITAAGGTPLPSGQIACVVTALAWPSFDSASFAFSDLEREYELLAESAPLTYSQP